MITGQIEVMKITKIADGLESRNAASDSGSQASGGTVRRTWKIGSRPRMAQTDWPTSGAERHADDGGEAEADGHALQRGQHPPAEADVLRAVDEERIDDQVIGFRPDLRRRRQARTRRGAGNLPDDEQQGDAPPAAADVARHAAARMAVELRRVESCGGRRHDCLRRLGGRAALGFVQGRHVHRLSSRMARQPCRRAQDPLGRCLDRQAFEIGGRVVGIEDLAVEEGLDAARRARPECRRPRRRAPSPPRATGPRG